MLFASYAASSLRSPSYNTTFSSPLLSKKDQRKPILSSNSKPLFPLFAFKIGAEEICEIAHNKVLVASALSCAIGQLSKSFFWAFNGAGIDLKAAVRSGGMPSTHSAGVAAAATSLALERPIHIARTYLLLSRLRGFSDPVFGMSVVIAALVMYDAQGVRREVGHHAKIMNKLFETSYINSKSQTSSANSRKVGSVLVDSSSAAVSSLLKTAVSSSCFETLQHLEAAVKEDFLDKSQQCISCSSLNESVGHTGIEVCAGAFLGFFVSLIVNAII